MSITILWRCEYITTPYSQLQPTSPWHLVLHCRLTQGPMNLAEWKRVLAAIVEDSSSCLHYCKAKRQQQQQLILLLHQMAESREQKKKKKKKRRSRIIKDNGPMKLLATCSQGTRLLAPPTGIRITMCTLYTVLIVVLSSQRLYALPGMYGQPTNYINMVVTILFSSLF